MSIEKLLGEHIAALNANTDALKAVLASGGKPAAAGTKAAATGTKAAPKAATGTKTTKSSGTTVEEVADKVTAYLKTGDKAERAKRKEQVGHIIEHFDAERFTTIDPTKFEEALGYLEDFEEGRTPEFMAGGDEDGDGDDDSMV